MTPADDRLSRYIFLFLFLLLSLSLVNSFYFDKHLSADGVHIFALILDSRDFTYITWSRQFAHYLIEWPLVLAIKLGVSNIPILIKAFALGIYLPYLISFGICIYALRHERKTLLLFALASIVAINLTSDYVLSGENQVMINMAWPILLLLLRRQALTWVDGLLLWILLALFSRLYETAIIPAWIYSVICLVRLYYYRRKEQVIIIAGVLLLCLLVVTITLYFAINPRDSSNKADFIWGVRAVLHNPEALSAASFMVIYTLGLLLKKRIIIIFAVTPIVMYIMAHWFVDCSVTANVSFASRTLSITLLPVLLVSAILVWSFKRELDRASMLVFAVFISTMVIANIHNAKNWNDFRHQVIQVVETRRGYVPIEETELKDNPYRWPWNNTELGLVWSAPCVKAVLLNQPGLHWEPFDPHKTLVLKNYLQYDEFFKSVDQGITTCQH